MLVLALLAAGCSTLLRAGPGAAPLPPASEELSLISQRTEQGSRVRLSETVVQRLYSVTGTT